MQPKTIYVFSGLGVDHRVFEHMDFEDNKVIHIAWIDPLKNESITSYARRLALQINEHHAIYIGLSFGGIIAIEVAKIIPASRIILLASVKTRIELPFYYKWAGFFPIHRLIPVSFLKQANRFTYRLFGVKETKDRQLLKQVLADTDPVFLKWALNAIVHWKNNEIHPNTTHIHGKKDRILPYRFVSCDISIEDGGHFMTVTHAEKISGILKALLS